VVQFVGRVVPYVMVIGAFTFLYMFMPNAPLRPKPALAGGVVGGLLWQTAGWGFATFVAGSTRYTAIYSSFAILVLFMIWLYLCWLVLLIGAAIAFYAQHPGYLRTSAPEHGPSNRLREHLAVAAMALVGRRFCHAQPPMTCAELAHAIGAPGDLLEPVLDALQRASLLVQTRDQPPAYVPARDVELIALADVIRVVRTAGELPHLDASRLHMEPQAREAVECLEQGIGDVLRGLSVGTLARDVSGKDGVAGEEPRPTLEAAGPVPRRARPPS
jgi:membrane protein